VFTEEDKHVIKVLRKEKRYSSRRLLKEFSNKKCTMSGLDHLLRKLTMLVRLIVALVEVGRAP